MELSSGMMVGSCRVEREVGRGGMGVVYLAIDTKLDRDVAIKALPEELAADPARLERFEREARTLASLNHPNLAGIYGIEEQEGARYLVLEYVEGETVADILDRGALAVDDALELAVQIAAGVEAAHEAGVIHRDLKPANIKVTPEGKAKVLDFGLARSDEGSTSASSIGLSNSPTVTSPVQHSPTIAGAILGTAPYMSPEQARGRKVDKRTDIWSFAVVVYEMLTGVGPFHGETATDSIGAILHKDVDLGLLPSGTPSAVRRVLQRCFARDKAQRYRDIGDVRLELAHARGEGSVDRPATAKGNKLLLPIAALVAVAAGVVGWLLKPGPGEPEPPAIIRFSVPLENLDNPSNPMKMCISPKEHLIAYIGRTPDDPEDQPRGVCLHDLRTGESIRLPGTDNARFLNFSPSGDEIAFSWFSPDSRREELRRVPTKGGPVLTVFVDKLGDEYNMSTLVWLSETEVLAASEKMDSWYRVSTATGLFTDLGGLNGLPEFSFGGATKLIDDRAVSVSLGHLTSDDIYFDTYLFDLDTMEATLLLNNATTVSYMRSGHIVFGREDTLCVAPFDLRTRSITGAVTPLISDLVSGVSFTASKSGDLLFSHGGVDSDLMLVWTTADGRTAPIISSERKFVGPIDVSSDGSRIITSIQSEQGPPTAHVVDIETGFVRPIGSGSLVSAGLRFMPDGRVAIVRVHSPNHVGIEIVDPDGIQETFVPLPETDSSGAQNTCCISPDGRYMLIVYTPSEEDKEQGIYIVDLEAGDAEREAVPLIVTEANESSPAISPDGEWLSYSSDASGEMQVLIRAFDPENPSRRTRTLPVSSGGGNYCFWSPDGSELYFLDADRNLMGAKISYEPEVSVGAPVMVLPDDQLKVGSKWGTQLVDIMPDGERFVSSRLPEGESTEIQTEYILNWGSGLSESSAGHAQR